MTFCASRNNIKPLFRRIAFMMVILLCLFGTITALQGIGPRQFACFNSSINSVLGFYRFGMTITVFAGSFLVGNFAFFTLRVLFSNNLTFFASLVFSGFYEVANFAIRAITNWATVSFMKFWKQFGLFTSATSFCYSLLRHNQFLTNWLCLGPAAAHTVVGSLCYNRSSSVCQLNQGTNLKWPLIAPY